MNQTVEELYPDDSPELQAIVKELRDLARKTMPEADEIFYHSALCYGPTGSGFDRIVYIMTHHDHVNLGFFFGTHLNDPHHLLEGTGKRMRHVKIRSIEEARNAALKLLLQEAWSDGLKSLPELHHKLRKKHE